MNASHPSTGHPNRLHSVVRSALTFVFLIASAPAWSWNASLTATPNPNTGDYTLTWIPNGSSGQYRVQERVSGASTWTTIFLTNGSTTSYDIVNQPIGDYDHRVWRKWLDCSGGGGRGGCNWVDEYSETIFVSVLDTIPPPPPPPPPVTDAIGAVPGSFAVSARGSATYTIPLNLVPGSNGLTPELALVYDHRLGETVAGIGWSISGLSTISRCAKTLAQDGVPETVQLTRLDRFCFDGSQLKITSGSYGFANSTYRTEVDIAARFTALGSSGNGPSSFKVERKDGLIFEYGNTADSRIETLAVGYESTIISWAVNKISDRSGNEITFTYEEDGSPYGSYRIDTVNYVLNPSQGKTTPSYTIDFVYQTQHVDDVHINYAAGGLVEDTKILDYIDILWMHQGGTNRRYELSYEQNLSSTSRSRLKSVEECAAPKGISTYTCLDATEFAYQNGTSGFGTPIASGSTIAGGEKALMLDVNGDGRTDVIYPSNGSTTKWHYRLASSSGGFESQPVNTNVENTGHDRAIGIDYNHDGIDDILVPHSGSNWWVMLGSTSGLQAPVDTNTPINSVAGNAIAVDMNGDGRQDLLYGENIGPGGSQGKIWVRYRQSSGTIGFSSTPTLLLASASGDYIQGPTLFEDNFPQSYKSQFDVNGDGFGDIAITFVSPGLPTSYATDILLGGSGTLTMTGAFEDVSGIPIDFNGDGYTDLAYENALGELKLKLGTGRNFADPISGPSLTNLDFSKAISADWDSDGFEDLILPNTSTNKWYYMRSVGDDLETAVDTGVATGGNVLAVGRVDVDGNGLDDIGFTKASGDFVYSPHLGDEPDLLTNVTDGNGNAVSFTYKPLTDTLVYQNSNDAVFPDQDHVSAIYVVHTAVPTNGIESDTYTLTYNYTGSWLNLTGRGLAGFKTKTTLDSRLALKNVETFHRTFPYRGRHTKTEVLQLNDTPVTETTLAWNKVDNGLIYNIHSLPYVQTSTTRTYEMGGGIYDGVQTTEVTTVVDAIDDYGTVTSQTTTTTEKTSGNGAQGGAIFTETIQLTNVSNSTTSWCLGKPGQIVSTKLHDQAGGAQIIRTVSQTWNTSSLCRLTQEIVEPGDPTYQVTRGIAYDGFGNVNSEVVTGYNMAPRTTSTTWTAYGQFPQTITNPLGHASTTSWDLSVGQPSSKIDPNNLEVEWTYDLFGRMIQEIRADGTYTDVSFTKCDAVTNSYCGTSYNRVKSKISSASKSVDHLVIRTDDSYLDKIDRVVHTAGPTVTGSISNVRTIYDEMGHVFQTSAPDISATPLYYESRYYDDLGRVTLVSRRVSDDDPTIQSTAVSYEGLSTTTTDAEGKNSTKVADAKGRVYRSIDHDGYYQQFEYDAFGSLLKVTDSIPGNGSLQEFTYAYGIGALRLTSYDMDMGQWSYTPNSLGEVTSHTDANGNTFAATYDLLSRPLSRIDPKPTGTAYDETTWVWGNSASAHNIGRLESVAMFDSVTLLGPAESYSYDDFGRMAQRTTNTDSSYETEYEFDPMTGQLASLTYPASTGQYRLRVKYDYQNGIVNKVSNYDSPSIEYWVANTVNAWGGVTTETLGNGLLTTRSFDAVNGSVDSIQSGLYPTVDRQNMTFLWNKVGSLKERHDGNRNLTEVFSYDNLHRMDYSTLGGSTNLDIDYDLMGNISSKDDVGTGTWTYHATKKHAVINAAGNTFTYDNNGNQITRNSDSVAWTSYNYPSQIKDGIKTYDYFYDANRMRWKQEYDNGAGQSETTVFIAGIMEKRTEGTFVQYRHYINVGNRPIALYTRDSNSGEFTNYFLTDHQGSVSAVTNSSGGYYVDESFTAFGDRRDPNDWDGSIGAGDQSAIDDASQRGFTFHTNAESSSFVHMNGRVADSLTGRFLSADPFVPNPGLTQSFNRYSYVRNNPLTYTDPSGFAECFDLFTCEALAVVTVFNFALDWLSSSNPPTGCLGAGAPCYGQAPSNKLKDFVSDVLQLVDFIRNPSFGFGVNMGGAGLGGFGTGAGGFGTGVCPPEYGPSCMSFDDDVSIVVPGKFETKSEALSAAIAALLEESLRKYREKKGELTTTVNRTADGQFKVTPIERHPCNVSKSLVCNGSLSFSLINTVYAIHTHPAGFDLGPSECNNCDFDAIETANEKRLGSARVIGIVINSNEQVIEYWQVTIDGVSFFNGSKTFRGTRLIRQ